MNTTSCGAMLLILALITSCHPQPKQAIKEPGSHALLGDGFGITTATVFVQNLDSARKFYAEVLGFDMTKPGKFDKGFYDGTLTAIASLPDYSTLELLSVKDSALLAKQDSSILAPLYKFQAGGMYSLSTSSADTTRRWLQAKGFQMDTLLYGRYSAERPKGWGWDDGGPQWRGVGYKNNRVAWLPGLIEYTGFSYQELQSEWKPYSWRKYYTDRNGVVGMAGLIIATQDLPAASKQFKEMGFDLLRETDTTAVFSIAHGQTLQLRSTASAAHTTTTAYPSRGAAGLYGICFEVRDVYATRDSLLKKLPLQDLRIDSAEKRLTIAPQYAYGMQLEFTQESKEQARLAQIYSFKDDTKLDTASVRYASTLYMNYCALCHGKEREGYAADHAPSLRSPELMATTRKPRSSYNFLEHTVAYGRAGTAMAPYAKSQGGPLDSDQIELLLEWLYQSSGVKKPIEMSVKPISGNAPLGKELYNQHCASCHGIKGEGIKAPALANPLLLATASDAFIYYTIATGRAGTPMPSFKDSLNKTQINAITAYIRSRAAGWNAPAAVNIKEPLPKDYIMHPQNKAPQLDLKEDRYVSANQLLKAFKDSARMIVLDARSKAAWHQSHIPGAVSVPYYEEPDKFIKNIPNDSTWVIVYCACPHAASGKVVNTLRRFGYKHTAILDEGILVWAQRGYPVQQGAETASGRGK